MLLSLKQNKKLKKSKNKNEKIRERKATYYVRNRPLLALL